MTNVLIPFKVVHKDLSEGIAYYQDDIRHVANVCAKCQSFHIRKSKFCADCSNEFKLGDEESYKVRLNKNQMIEESNQGGSEEIVESTAGAQEVISTEEVAPTGTAASDVPEIVDPGTENICDSCQ